MWKRPGHFNVFLYSWEEKTWFSCRGPLKFKPIHGEFLCYDGKKKGGCTVEIHYWNLKDDKRKRPDWTIYIQNSMLAFCCIVKVPDVSVLFRCDNPDTFPCPSKGDLECTWESDSAQFFNVAMAKQSKYSALHNLNMNKNTTIIVMSELLSRCFRIEHIGTSAGVSNPMQMFKH
jgi:hypothetical protein